MPKTKKPRPQPGSSPKTLFTSCLSCLPPCRPFPSCACASWPWLPSFPSSCHRRGCTLPTQTTGFPAAGGTTTRLAFFYGEKLLLFLVFWIEGAHDFPRFCRDRLHHPDFMSKAAP